MSGRVRSAAVGGVFGLLVGLVFAVAVVLAPSAAGQSAATIDAVGWWTRVPGASAPENGFAVGQAPDGALSVAALRVSVGDGGRPTRAVLRFAEDSGVGQSNATLQACATSDQWEPAAGGPMAEAPQAACDARSVPCVAPRRARGAAMSRRCSPGVRSRS